MRHAFSPFKIFFYGLTVLFLLGICNTGYSIGKYQQKNIQNIDTLKKINPKDSLKVQPVDSSKIGPWKLEGNLVLNFAQTFLENWAAGGDNSLAGNTINTVNSHFKKNKIEWENTFNLAGGLMQLEKGKVVKTDDKVEFITKLGRKSNKHWNYSSQLSFQTQFFPGYKNSTDTIKRSDFLSPGYVNILLGMDYKPIKQIAIFLSPLSAKITILDSYFISNYYEEGVYGVSKGGHERYEMGGSLEFQAKGDFNKLNYNTNLKSFLNYVTEPQNIDVSWEVILGLKLNKFFSANLKTNLVYDDDSQTKIQFKEFLGFGFSYKI